jgi:dTDP-glucose 4,6-dehydratase
MAEAFYRSYGLPVVTVRPFNTFGPRQSARAVIPSIITQCLSGKTIRLGNLHPTRDLNYVGNTVDGFLLAAQEEKAIGKTINVGSGREIGIGDLAQLIMKVVGRRVPIESDPERIRPSGSEVDRLLADNSLARQLLGWRPIISLREGLETTVAWMRDHLERYRPDVYVV